MISHSNPAIKSAIWLAFLSATLYALYPPIAKLMIHGVGPAMLSALLYLGTGLGLSLMAPLIHRFQAPGTRSPYSRTDIPMLTWVILLNILAAILMNWGIRLTSAASISLLSNFEIVATTALASLFFHERVRFKLWLAIMMIFIASCLLSVHSFANLTISVGAVLAILATVCWGIENNFTSALSSKDPLELTIIKGWGVGLGSLIVAAVQREAVPSLTIILVALVLGLLSFGISIFFYVSAQSVIGAARTSAYYAVAPFISVIISLIFLHESITGSFIVALILMAFGTYLVTKATFSA